MNNIISKITDIISYTLSKRLSAVLNIILLPLITPHLTLEDFGLFGVYSSVLFIISSMIPVGQNLYIENSFFTHKKKYLLVWRRCLSIMNFISFFYMIIFSVIIYFLFLENNSDYIILLISGLVYIFLNSYDIVLRSFHIYNNKSVSYLKKNSIKSVIIFFTTYFLIVKFQLGYLGWVISIGLSQLITLIVFSREILITKLYPFSSIKKRWLLTNLKETSKLIPYQLSSQVINLSDKILLTTFNVNINQIGMYSQGYNFGYNAKSINDGIFSAFAYRVQMQFRSKNYKDLGSYITKVLVSFSVISIIFQLWTKEIFSILFRKVEFLESHSIAGLVFSSITFLVIYAFLNSYLVIHLKSKLISIIGVSAALINLIINIVLIPDYGIYASISGTLITHFLLSISFLFFTETRTVFKKIFNINIIIAYLFTHLIILLVIYEFYDSFTIVSRIFTSLFLTLFLIIFLKFKNND